MRCATWAVTSGRPDVLHGIPCGCYRVQISDSDSGRPGLSQQLGSVMEFVCVSEAAAGTVETIVPPSWEDVHVIVPYVLAAVGLVVLTSRDGVAAEGCLHGDGDRTNGSLNWRAELDWQVINVFVVIIRDDQHRTWVPRPPLRIHLHKDTVVAMNELEREVRCPRRRIPTEGTTVIRRLVVVHDAIFVDGPRAYASSGVVVQGAPRPPEVCGALTGRYIGESAAQPLGRDAARAPLCRR